MAKGPRALDTDHLGHAGEGQPAARSARGAQTTGEAERAILPVSIQLEVGCRQVHACVARFFEAHATLPQISTGRGSRSGRSFVLRFVGMPIEATQRAEKAFLEPSDGAGQGRALDIEVGRGGPTWL